MGGFGAVGAVVDSGEVLEVCLGEDSAKCVKEALVEDAVADAREDLVTIAREALGTMEEGEVKILKNAKELDGSMTASVTVTASSRALSGSDTLSSPMQDTTLWEFKDIEFIVGKDDNTRLTNGDTITSLVSEEMICSSWRNGDTTLEPHKLGPAPRSNPGPPFTVGNVIWCDVPGCLFGGDMVQSVLQWDFVLEAKDPRYKIRLENGTTVCTDTKESWLKPRWAPGEFAEDQNDPFSNFHAEPTLRLGSYGLHIDSQLDSLEKVVQAKAFSKAVKLDDANVPAYLWNDWVWAPGTTIKRQDWALDVL